MGQAQYSGAKQNTNGNLRADAIAGKQFADNMASNALSLVVRPVASVPTLFYGTAWKKERTAELVELAVRTGFRAIDTACQPKHYYEPGVGAALVKLYEENVITRDKLFLQTKFTAVRGQDPNNIPYNPQDPLPIQVKTSFQASLRNLHTDYIDSLVLHSPMSEFSDTTIGKRPIRNPLSFHLRYRYICFRHLDDTSLEDI